MLSEHEWLFFAAVSLYLHCDSLDEDKDMAETTNFQMAIDLLCCHLGITEEEAKQQLGIGDEQRLQKQVIDAQQALMGFGSDR